MNSQKATRPGLGPRRMFRSFPTPPNLYPFSGSKNVRMLRQGEFTLFLLSSTDLTLKLHVDDIYRIEEDFRIETFYLGLGIISSLSIWYSIQYLHRGIYESSRNELGDSFFKLWVYLGDYYDDLLHLGCLCSLRLPTGKNAYSNEEWRNLSLGNHEIKIGPVIQLDVKKNMSTDTKM